MIRPGRRRRAGPPELDWHLRLAASRRRRLRTRRGAWTGLAGAFVGAIWVLAGGPPWATPALAALGAVVGAAVPARGSEAWARSWIGARHGLGYDTALEAEGRPDPHGLWAASRDRARLGLRGATPPAAERWWLPPAIAAVLLITASPWLATIPRPSAPALDRAATEAARPDRDAGGATPRADGESGGPSGPAGAAPPPERPDVATDGAAPPPDARDAPAARDQAESDGPAADGDDEASATGGAAVDRFLRDLEPTPDEATNPFDPAGRRADEEGSPEARTGGEAAPEDVPPRSGDDGSETGQPTDASGEGSPSDGSAPEGTGPRSDGGATPDSARDEAGDEAGSDGGGDQADGGDGARDREADGEGASAAPDAASGESEGGAGTPEGQPDDGAEAAARDGRDEADAAGLDPGEGEAGGAGAAGGDGRDGDAAGAAGGEAGGAEPSPEGEAQPFLGGPDGAAERLSGRPDEGPAPSVGSVRGGGQAPASVPEGAPADPSYGRAAEQAADEAGLPGAYREIIRRYFR